MVQPTPIPDHIAQAIARLIAQYQEKERITGLLTGLLADTQSQEDVFTSLRDIHNIETATGVTLDNIGSIVVLTRNFGESDADYLIRIKQKIFQNTSTGTPEVIIQLVKSLTGASVVHFLEGVIAYFEIEMDLDISGDQNLIDTLYAAIRSAKVGGVQFGGVAYAENDGTFFVVEDGVGLGFSDEFDPTVGGVLAEQMVETGALPGLVLGYHIELEDGSGLLLTEDGDSLIATTGED